MSHVEFRFTAEESDFFIIWLRGAGELRVGKVGFQLYHCSIPVIWLKFNLIHLINKILETDQCIVTDWAFFLLNLQTMSDSTGLDWVGFIQLNVDIWNTDVYLQQVALGFLVSQWRPSQWSLTYLALKHTCGVDQVNRALKILISYH